MGHAGGLHVRGAGQDQAREQDGKVGGLRIQQEAPQRATRDAEGPAQGGRPSRR